MINNIRIIFIDGIFIMILYIAVDYYLIFEITV